MTKYLNGHSSLVFFIILLFATAGVYKNKEKISDIEAKVDAYVKPYIDAGGFGGSILIARGDKILLSKGYGMANVEFSVPNSPKTKFQIASLSKTFTASAIMMLQERGGLSINDPLSKFIPDYPNGNQITIHHLLTHTSGIPNVNDFPDYDQKSRFPQSLEQIIEMFKQKPLEFQPGEKYSYSNSNYNLLAYVIEKVSGMSYGTFLKKCIFEPLDMKDTGHHGDASAIVAHLASGYQPSGAWGIEKSPYLDWSMKTGNGSLYSTVEDLYKWDRSLYTETILSKRSLDKMFKEHLEGVGYGWFVGKRFGKRITRYNGRSPGYTSYLERYIDDDACIIVLSNNYAPVPHIIINDLAAILFGEKYSVPEEVRPVSLDPNTMSAYIGRYRFGSDFYRPNAVVSVIGEEDHISFAWTETYKTPLRPLSETTFLDRTFWATILFQKNSNGEVTGLIWRDSRDYAANKINEK
ncbi:MAG: serine hydrolase domain-containing protein [bacterium]